MALIKTTTPTDPCTLLALAKLQMNLLLTGQGVSEIETPGLGRVQFAATSVGDLQRYIDALQAQCDAQNGVTSTSGRKPFSFEAWP